MGNELESYIFESRNRLYEEKAVEKVSSEDERNDFLKILEESEEWIWDVEVESVGVFKGKVRELKKIGDVMFVKADEIEARPAAVDAAGKTLGNLFESVDMLQGIIHGLMRQRLRSWRQRQKKQSNG